MWIMKQIKEFPEYYISTDGKVWSRKSKRFLIGYVTSKGYRKVELSIGRISEDIFVHRLVAQTYIPNPYNYPFINHKDLNRLNNDLSNLEWCTAKMNVDHQIEKRTHISTRPHKYGNKPKLTYDDAVEIRRQKGKVVYTKLAEIYRVSLSCILFIWTNRTYKERTNFNNGAH